MKRRRSSGLLAVLGALFVVVLGATAAAAQAPVKEVIQVDDTFVDPVLSAECGVEVTVTQTGQVTIITFPDGKVLQSVSPLNLAVVFSAGVDQVRVQRDGSLILSIVGQVPVGFTGVLKINPETEEVLQEPHHVVDIEEFCARLTA
jgi:hypothetical protein